MERRAGGDGWEECSRVSVKLQILFLFIFLKTRQKERQPVTQASVA